MKFAKKLFSLLLVCSFIFGCSATTASTCYNEIAIWMYKEKMNDKYDIGQGKVRFEGIGNASSESDSQIVEAFNEKETKPRLVIHLNHRFKDSLERPDDDVSLEEAKALLRQQRANVKEYYTRTNKEYMKKLSLEKLDVNCIADKYAPFIFAEFNNEITEKDIAHIYELSKQDLIKTIYVKSETKIKEELDSAIDAIDATNIITNAGTNGDGIIIGIMEPGIVDVNNSNFANTNVTVRGLSYETVTNHATTVASVALGVAPAASILSVHERYDLDDEIEWLLDNEVNVVNMSYGSDGQYEIGEYTSESAYIDSIALDTWVTFVGSSGNRGESDAYVTPPNGYNMLTVGACSNNGGLSPVSSYKEKFDINFPNIVAPGQGLVVPTFSGSGTGTSLSAAMTTGTIAVLMQYAPAIITAPEKVLSVIMASAQRLAPYATSSGFDDRVGTGMLNLANALVAVSDIKSFSVTSDNVGSYISQRMVYLERGDRIRVAFASLVNNNNGDPNEFPITDYDLHLLNSIDEIVAYDVGTHNNEFIEYVAELSGFYTIKIKQLTPKEHNGTDYCAYSWFVIE